MNHQGSSLARLSANQNKDDFNDRLLTITDMGVDDVGRQKTKALLSPPYQRKEKIMAFRSDGR